MSCGLKIEVSKNSKTNDHEGIYTIISRVKWTERFGFGKKFINKPYFE